MTIHSTNHLDRAQKALLGAQQDARKYRCDEATKLLRAEPCLAFVLNFNGCVQWSPELDIAIRMLMIARSPEFVHDGRLIWGLQPEWVTENSIRSASTTLLECLSLLKQRDQPFTLLSHVHGQTTVQIHAGEDDVDSELDEITAALSNDVLWHLGEFSMRPGSDD